MTDEDIALMTRLFGPELSDVPEMMDATEDAKGVDWLGEFHPAALDCLLMNVVHSGIGGGFCIGWARTSADGRSTLSIRRMKTEQAVAA